MNKKTGEKADHFIGYWLTILDKGRNARGFFARNRAAKDIDHFWKTNGMAQLLEAAGPLTEKLVYEQLYDSIMVFYRVCTTDRQYGSKLLGLGTMKPDDIEKKIAYEMCAYILNYLLQIEPVMFRPLIYRAVWFGYIASFPDNSDFLERNVKKLPENEQVKILDIIGEAAPGEASISL